MSDESYNTRALKIVTAKFTILIPTTADLTRQRDT